MALPCLTWLRGYNIRENLLVCNSWTCLYCLATLAVSSCIRHLCHVLLPVAYACCAVELATKCAKAHCSCSSSNSTVCLRPSAKLPTAIQPCWALNPDSAAASQLDVLAGTSVAALVVPQGMSYAKSAGLPSVYGLYGAFVPVIIYAALGSSRHLVRP